MTSPKSLVEIAACDPVVEAAFLEDYRRPSMGWVSYGGVVIALLYAGFAVLGAASETHTSFELGIRIVIAMALALGSLVVLRGESYLVQRYLLVALMMSGVAWCGALCLWWIASERPHFPVSQITPGLLVGLMFHYTILRLPVPLLSLIAGTVSVVAISWMFLEAPREAFVRSAIYIVAANLFGMSFARSIERRERALFLARRRAEDAESQAREAQNRAEEAHAHQNCLIAAVAHDLRQPMAASIHSLEAVRTRVSGFGATSAGEALDRTRSALDLLNTMLEEMLAAARHDSDRAPLRRTTIQLNAVVREVYEATVDEAERQGVCLRVRVGRLPLEAFSDAPAIRRALFNLVSNAVKFAARRQEPGAEVLIAVRRRARYVQVDVIDNGPGIPQEHVAKIWRCYVQRQTAANEDLGGLGLGLFLVSRLTEQLEGHTIRLRSREGHGTCFSLILPVPPGQPGKPAAAQPATFAPARVGAFSD